MSSENFNYINGFIKGIAVGLVVPAAIYPFDKTQTLVQVRDKRQAISQLMRDKPFKGLGVSSAYSMGKMGLIFGLTPIFETAFKPYIISEEVTKRVAEMSAAVLTPLLIAPIAVIRTRIQAEEVSTIGDVLRGIPANKRVQQLSAGAATSSLRYGVYYPTYFFTSDTIEFFLRAYARELFPENHQRTHHAISALSGGVGAIAATVTGYPLQVLANRKRIRTTPIPNVALIQQLWKRAGAQVFWRGLIKLGIPRITLAGALTNWIRTHFE